MYKQSLSYRFMLYFTSSVFLCTFRINKFPIIFTKFYSFTGDNWNNNEIAKNNLKRNGAFSEPNATMEVAQLILSLLHAWGIDPDLDRVCEGKLGLLRPMVPVSFGVLSKGGTSEYDLVY